MYLRIRWGGISFDNCVHKKLELSLGRVHTPMRSVLPKLELMTYHKNMDMCLE